MENILYPVLSNQNKLSGLNIEKGMPNCKSLAMSRIGLKIYQKKQRQKLRQHNGKEANNIPRLKMLFPKWDKNDKAKSFISQRKFVENTGNIESIIELIISQNVFSDPDLLSSFVECCKLALQKTEQSELEWFNFVRGHDLEWFIRFHNKIGTKRLREILLSGINFDILSEHHLFQSVEEWRKKIICQDYLFPQKRKRNRLNYSRFFTEKIFLFVALCGSKVLIESSFERVRMKFWRRFFQ